MVQWTMPLKENPEHSDYARMPLDELAALALATARARDAQQFQAILEGIGGCTNYMDAERAITDTLLANDELFIYKNSFELGYLAQWCKDNTEHVVRHCPEVLQCWAEPTTGVRTSTVHGRIAEVLETMPQAARLALLQGRSREDHGGFEDTTAHRMLHKYLAQGRYHWRVISPQWIGVAGSPLRQAAIELGWEAHYLPKMVHRNAFGPTAGEWLGRIPYAYTMLACEEHVHEQAWGEYAQRGAELLAAQAVADPVDVAMAQAIFKRAAYPQRGISLRRHRATPALDKNALKSVDNFVEAHVIMGTLSDLAQSLAQGVTPQLVRPETLPLPDLGSLEP